MKEVRLALNMSQEEFGKKIGLSKSGISNIEKGERGLRDTYINTLCTKFGIDCGWLRTGYGEMFLTDSVTSCEAFEKYLKSLGYSIFPSNGESETSIVLSKNGSLVTYTENEFAHFQDEVKKSVEYQIWQKSQK